jgi:hypothetical protein
LLLTGSDIASFLTYSREHAGPYAEEFGLQDEIRYSNRCASPYSSGKQVLKRKHGIVSAQMDNVFTSHGHTYEPIIRNWWRKMHEDAEVEEYGLITSPSVASSFLAASPDGISPDLGCVLEFKVESAGIKKTGNEMV